MPGNRTAVVLLDRHGLAGKAARDSAAQQQRRVVGNRVIRLDRDPVGGSSRRCRDREREDRGNCEASSSGPHVNDTNERRTNHPSETEAIAAELARELRVGDVVTVSGELGSGKTTFVRGASRALGVRDRVTSP
ncbi:MAG: tRNA (adenosine(37)-N6)-threonylcarbamoyltransferase complex ATPase subunit type 1 TsaE, partial [Acidobacteria bacterium]|nr:tRNA (adenosine(37)-N6)-threonylcarbamoyltransferase complex ATPase subunit type 1 TsaE [Acidobacteriota bacterium]